MYLFFSVFHQGASVQGINSGNYSIFKREQLIIIRGTVIELLGTNLKTGKLTTLSYANLFRFNISIISFRFKNKNKDFFSLLDNEGNITLFSVDKTQKFILFSNKNIGNKNLKESLYPYLAALNKKNLIYMICAVEKLKFSFFIGKNKFKNPVFFKNKMEIRHPSIICYHITTYEAKKRNGFLTIETCYIRPYDKFLVFYEINFQYNIIKRKIIAKINSTSYLIIPLENFITNDFLLIFSESLVTMVNIENKNFFTRNIPFRKTKSKSSQTFISSYGVLSGKFNIFLLIANQNGDLLKIYFNKPIQLIKTHREMFIEYFDTLLGKIRFLTLLKNGHLFASMDSGNHFYFQFLSLGKKKIENQKFFYPRLNYRNLKIIDELSSMSPILSFDQLILPEQRITKLFLLSGTGSNSSVRLLQESCDVSLLGIKRFKLIPTGINIIGKEIDSKYLFISFSIFTQCFLLGKNLEEINGDGFIYDESTSSIEKINFQNRILQFTFHKIRLIYFRKKKRKIIEWRPLDGSAILDSAIFRIDSLNIFLILSNGKGVLIKIFKGRFFIELENIDLRYKIFFSLFGTTYLHKSSEEWDLIILFSKKEKSLRIFSINKKNFMKLIGIHILPWTPETAKFILKKTKIILLISLNNGMIMETEFNPKNGRIFQINAKILCFSPLYISKNFFEGKILLFGSKIWTLNYDVLGKNIFKCIFNEQVSLVEALDDFLFICKNNCLKILIKKKKNYFFSKSIKIKITSTPRDFCNLDFNGFFHIVALVFKEKFSGICDHQMNLSVREAMLMHKLKFFKFSDHNWTSGICLTKFPYINVSFKKKKEYIFDIILIRGSNGKKSISTIFSKNFFQLKKSIIIVSMKNCEKKLSTICPMFLIGENYNFSSSLGIFSLKHTSIYSYRQGGRYAFGEKITFLFEFFCPIFSSGNLRFFLGKVSFGHRLLICMDKNVMVCEIKKNSIKVIHNLCSTPHFLSCVDTFGNRLITTDEIRGLKLFKFKKKKTPVNLLCEKKNINWIIGCKMFDPVSFLIWDKIGKISFFRIGIDILATDKFSHKVLKNSYISLLTQIKTNYTLIKLFCFKYYNSSKTDLLFFANLDGTLGIITIFFKNHIISCLKKIFLSLTENKKRKKKTLVLYLNKNSNIIDINILKLLKIFYK
ncbi:splicing factor 3b subunit 3 (nucleomorph) [Chroomonas mesostigmatica CCMP1168]|uniref:Splicing factor 3b subunit 3 n=1 Tax=Chroomonas mesostigmatica CCMP1168 TaxID=1195612 RepID=J7G5S8_9CRYP|nr:splicing factor 3b subunit 3 [Chroomonas mesostigmatica CCMP1168]